MADHILDKEHWDVTFMKSDEISLVLSRGLAETYTVQPKNPVEYFCKFLLSHAKTQKKAVEVSITEHI